MHLPYILVSIAAISTTASAGPHYGGRKQIRDAHANPESDSVTKVSQETGNANTDAKDNAAHSSPASHAGQTTQTIIPTSLITTFATKTSCTTTAETHHGHQSKTDHKHTQNHNSHTKTTITPLASSKTVQLGSHSHGTKPFVTNPTGANPLCSCSTGSAHGCSPSSTVLVRYPNSTVPIRPGSHHLFILPTASTSPDSPSKDDVNPAVASGHPLGAPCTKKCKETSGDAVTGTPPGVAEVSPNAGPEALAIGILGALPKALMENKTNDSSASMLGGSPGASSEESVSGAGSPTTDTTGDLSGDVSEGSLGETPGCSSDKASKCSSSKSSGVSSDGPLAGLSSSKSGGASKSSSESLSAPVSNGQESSRGGSAEGSLEDLSEGNLGGSSNSSSISPNDFTSDAQGSLPDGAAGTSGGSSSVASEGSSGQTSSGQIDDSSAELPGTPTVASSSNGQGGPAAGSNCPLPVTITSVQVQTVTVTAQPGQPSA